MTFLTYLAGGVSVLSSFVMLVFGGWLGGQRKLELAAGGWMALAVAYIAVGVSLGLSGTAEVVLLFAYLVAATYWVYWIARDGRQVSTRADTDRSR